MFLFSYCTPNFDLKVVGRSDKKSLAAKLKFMALQKNNDVISIELQRLKVRLLSAECEPPLLRVYSPCRAIDLEIDKIKRTNGRRVKCQVNVWVIAVVEPVDGSQALAKFAYRPCTEFVNVFSLNLVF